MKQKDVFLEKEGDAWYTRNAPLLLSRSLPQADPLLQDIRQLPDLPPQAAILEVGCSDGTRLAWIKRELGLACHGVEPSHVAVDAARSRGVAAVQGTADSLPYERSRFDIVVFGFCLYLCDPDDLFRIACEADRVLRDPGWLLLLDFYSPTPTSTAYRHREGITSRKLDYRGMFAWHPAYTTFSHRVLHHSTHRFTDERHEWVGVSVLRKNSRSVGW